MKFSPKSNEEILSMGLLKDGIYDFEVFDAQDRISKSGNEMIEIQLKVYDDEGRAHTVFDYLLEAMAFKLRHFAENTGLISKYENGELNAADCIGKTGKVQLILQASQMDKNGKIYPPKNSVKDYVQSNAPHNGNGSLPHGKPVVDNSLEQDIPF